MWHAFMFVISNDDFNMCTQLCACFPVQISPHSLKFSSMSAMLLKHSAHLQNNTACACLELLPHFGFWSENRGKYEGWQSPGSKPRTLACAASVLPRSYDNWTTTSPHYMYSKTSKMSLFQCEVRVPSIRLRKPILVPRFSPRLSVEARREPGNEARENQSALYSIN